MSIENIHEYVRRCLNEPELREAAKGIGLTDIEGHMRHAESLGLGFSEDDLTAFRREVIAADGEFGDDGLEDLSVEELERVAGGVVATTLAVAVGVGAGVGAGAAAVAAGGAAAAATSSAW